MGLGRSGRFLSSWSVNWRQLNECFAMGTDQRQAKVIAVCCTLRPALYLLVSLQIKPCLLTSLVTQSPSLDVGSLILCDERYRSAVVVLLMMGVTIGLAPLDHDSQIRSEVWMVLDIQDSRNSTGLFFPCRRLFPGV